MDLRLKDRKAIVTGATRGIGLRIARQLADEGVHLGISSRTATAVDETVGELQKKGVTVVGDAIDITDAGTGTHSVTRDPAGIKHAIKFLAAHWHNIREPVLVGSTGVKVPMSIESLIWQFRADL